MCEFINSKLPCYNRETHIEKFLEELLAINMPDMEVICVDDGSTDGTAALLASQPDLRVLRFDRGKILSHCRNAGIEAATVMPTFKPR